MSSPKFESVKRANPALAGLLDRLGAYIRTQIGSGQDFIIPKLAAAALRLNDGEAFVLLELLATGNVMRRVYNVYCRRTNMLLDTVDSIEQLDRIPHCDFCDSDHNPRELRVEIAFVLDDHDVLTRAA